MKKTSNSTTKADPRDRRLAEALRANLRKRKEAARTKSDTADAAQATAPAHDEP